MCASACRERSSWPPCPSTTRSSCAAASRPTPRRSPPAAPAWSSAEPGSASTTSTSPPPPPPASPSSTPPPATPSPPPSTPWPCSSHWLAASRPPTPRCTRASGTAPRSWDVSWSDKTLGVIGLGKIGMAVADRARALGMNVVGYDPYVTDEAARLHGISLMSVRGDPRACRRGHRPRAQDQGHRQPHLDRRAGLHEARRLRHQRRPRRRHRRGGAAPRRSRPAPSPARPSTSTHPSRRPPTTPCGPRPTSS